MTEPYDVRDLEPVEVIEVDNEPSAEPPQKWQQDAHHSMYEKENNA